MDVTLGQIFLDGMLRGIYSFADAIAQHPAEWAPVGVGIVALLLGAWASRAVERRSRPRR